MRVALPLHLRYSASSLLLALCSRMELVTLLFLYVVMLIIVCNYLFTLTLSAIGRLRFEPQHYNPNKGAVRPRKTQIGLGIRPV